MSYKEQAIELGIKVDGRWSEDRIKAEIIKHTSREGDAVIVDSLPILDKVEPAKPIMMNFVARRIFDGQGSIPDVERVRRIVVALRNKGYSEDEIKQLDLPIENLSKYLG